MGKDNYAFDKQTAHLSVKFYSVGEFFQKQ